MKKVVWFVLTAVACTGDGKGNGDSGGEAEACSARPGTWTLAFTRDAASDPDCPEIEPGTFEVDDDDTTSSCDPGCDCAFEEDAATCTATMSQACVDAESESTIDCDFELEDPEHMSGACTFDVSVPSAGMSLTCSYTVSATHGG